MGKNPSSTSRRVRKGGCFGNRFLGWGRPGRRGQPAQESLIGRATLAEVPLAGLSFVNDQDGG
jgi:hypothetical protein